MAMESPNFQKLKNSALSAALSSPSNEMSNVLTQVIRSPEVTSPISPLVTLPDHPVKSSVTPLPSSTLSPETFLAFFQADNLFKTPSPSIRNIENETSPPTVEPAVHLDLFSPELITVDSPVIYKKNVEKYGAEIESSVASILDRSLTKNDRQPTPTSSFAEFETYTQPKTQYPIADVKSSKLQPSASVPIYDLSRPITGQRVEHYNITQSSGTVGDVPMEIPLTYSQKGDFTLLGMEPETQVRGHSSLDESHFKRSQTKREPDQIDLSQLDIPFSQLGTKASQIAVESPISPNSPGPSDQVDKRAIKTIKARSYRTKSRVMKRIGDRKVKLESTSTTMLWCQKELIENTSSPMAATALVKQHLSVCNEVMSSIKDASKADHEWVCRNCAITPNIFKVMISHLEEEVKTLTNIYKTYRNTVKQLRGLVMNTSPKKILKSKVEIPKTRTSKRQALSWCVVQSNNPSIAPTALSSAHKPLRSTTALPAQSPVQRSRTYHTPLPHALLHTPQQQHPLPHTLPHPPQRQYRPPINGGKWRSLPATIIPGVKVEQHPASLIKPRAIVPRPAEQYSGRLMTQQIPLPPASPLPDFTCTPRVMSSPSMIEEVQTTASIEVIQNFFKDQVALINRGENVVALSQKSQGSTQPPGSLLTQPPVSRGKAELELSEVRVPTALSSPNSLHGSSSQETMLEVPIYRPTATTNPSPDHDICVASQQAGSSSQNYQSVPSPLIKEIKIRNSKFKTPEQIKARVRVHEALNSLHTIHLSPKYRSEAESTTPRYTSHPNTDDIDTALSNIQISAESDPETQQPVELSLPCQDEANVDKVVRFLIQEKRVDVGYNTIYATINGDRILGSLDENGFTYQHVSGQRATTYKSCQHWARSLYKRKTISTLDLVRSSKSDKTLREEMAEFWSASRAKQPISEKLKLDSSERDINSNNSGFTQDGLEFFDIMTLLESNIEIRMVGADEFIPIMDLNLPAQFWTVDGAGIPQSITADIDDWPTLIPDLDFK